MRGQPGVARIRGPGALDPDYLPHPPSTHRWRLNRHHIGPGKAQSSRAEQREPSPAEQARSRTARAELTFSVSQVERRLREGRYAQRLSWSASVFLAATLECLTAKVLELAGNEARHSARRRITPELLDMAVHNNALLSGLFGTTTISQVAQPRR
ncbi:histone H2A-Bbd type 2/3-like [Marmota flaviventris]|uniref:histone H2A-Bbd type 1 n=1 Tax=Marmota flaviventris TaxID=93162 RepID=UPI003A83CBFD